MDGMWAIGGCDIIGTVDTFELRWLSINAKSSRAGASGSPWCRCGSRRLVRFFHSEAIFPNNSHTR